MFSHSLLCGDKVAPSHDRAGGTHRQPCRTCRFVHQQLQQGFLREIQWHPHCIPQCHKAIVKRWPENVSKSSESPIPKRFDVLQPPWAVAITSGQHPRDGAPSMTMSWVSTVPPALCTCVFPSSLLQKCRSVGM